MCCQTTCVARRHVLPDDMCCQTTCVARWHVLPGDMCCQVTCVARWHVLPGGMCCRITCFARNVFFDRKCNFTLHHCRLMLRWFLFHVPCLMSHVVFYWRRCNVVAEWSCHFSNPLIAFRRSRFASVDLAAIKSVDPAAIKWLIFVFFRLVFHRPPAKPLWTTSVMHTLYSSYTSKFAYLAVQLAAGSQ